MVQLDLGVEEGDGAGDVISTEGTSRLWVPRGCRLVLYRGEERVDENDVGGGGEQTNLMSAHVFYVVHEI